MEKYTFKSLRPYGKKSQFAMATEEAQAKAAAWNNSSISSLQIRNNVRGKTASADETSILTSIASSGSGGTAFLKIR
jgi:hypothetical protein